MTTTVPIEAPPSVTVEQYLRTSYESLVEYVDGELHDKGMPGPLHSTLLFIVIKHLAQYHEQYGFAVLPDCRLRVAERRVRLPDVMALRPPYRPGRVVTDVPLATIEVLSPDDTWHDVRDTCRDYARLGVPNIVVLDPQERAAHQWQDGRLVEQPIQALHLPEELPFPTDELFQQIARELPAP